MFTSKRFRYFEAGEHIVTSSIYPSGYTLYRDNDTYINTAPVKTRKYHTAVIGTPLFPSEAPYFSQKTHKLYPSSAFNIPRC